jgi:hypothetical protein
MTAANIAKERLELLLEEKLKGENDLTSWEFYNFLTEQAKKHKIDFSGYSSISYQNDREVAKSRTIHN